MASSVFFRFKSQKEPSRVTFDGTGISVFELKREIITTSGLGDGTDFELILSSDENNEIYDDDTTIIPRSTTVIAKRLPASKPGRGGAARYVSGKMPVNAKNTHRSETVATKSNPKGHATASTKTVGNVSELQTEEERMAAVLKMGADQWEQQQQEMANATPVHHNVPMKGKPVNVPDHPPPPGYICYRCGKKGHYIQVCPTNDDPTFDGRPRIKRTTGIPRSFLKVVERPAALTNDGTTDDSKQPSGVMVNADGDWVIAEPDNASWEQYQARTKVSAAAQEEVVRGSKELRDKGLECSIDKRLFVDPTKTPCCHTTYCNECITNALLDDDLQCPGCGKDGILIDDLAPDDDMVTKIRSYEEEKVSAKKEQEKQKEKEKNPVVKQEAEEQKEKEKDPVVKQEADIQVSAECVDANSPGSGGKSPSSTTPSNSKKRPAEADLENNRVAPGPNEQAATTTSPSKDTPSALSKDAPSAPTTKPFQFPPELAFLNQPPFSNAGVLPEINTMAFPNMNNFMGMGVPMNPMMPMVPNMQNPMLNPMMLPNTFPMAGMPNQWPNMPGMFPLPNSGMYNNSFQGNMMGNTGYNGQIPMGNNFNNANGANFGGGRGAGSFQNQQRTSNRPNAEDSAYFRQPVNPHRHQGRRNVPRPTDYREI